MENAFALPGMGRLLADAVYARDVTVIQGAVLVIALLYVSINVASSWGIAGSIRACVLHVAIERATRWSRRGAALWLLALAALATAAPWLPLDDPARIDLAARSVGPDARHWLGTDALGSRPARPRGLWRPRFAGHRRRSARARPRSRRIGRAVRGFPARMAGCGRAVLIDTLLAFPALILALIVGVYVGRGLAALVFTLAVMSVPACARVARSAALAVSRHDYVLAARAGGASELRILWRHVLPNVWTRLATFALLLAALVVVVEGALGFLGLGMAPPQPSWGGMIAAGRAQLEDAPLASLVPAAALFLTVLALNVLGDPRRSGAAVRHMTLRCVRR